MTTDFFILCAQTVPSNYTWDIGTPLLFANNLQDLFSIEAEVTGYAPALNVIFYNNSVYDPTPSFVEYLWDFGDYYNFTNNFVSLSCSSVVLHTYVMPGTYTVSLKQIRTTIPPIITPTLPDPICRGKYDINWYWNKHTCLVPETCATNLNALTWNDVTCTSPSASKWWDNEYSCFQKYCKNWSWYDLSLSGDGRNPVTWTETETDQTFQKKWMYEANDTICGIIEAPSITTSIETVEETVIKTLIVKVLEIPPVASIVSVSAVIGNSPLTVRLSPRNCRPGSFPIDRIDWDFGDGSPIISVSRYSLPANSERTINTEYFISDLNDVRNIDVQHTYYRDKDTYPVFYPSLTCYSANTSTADSCCLTVGPISFTETPTNIHLLKTRNTQNGNFYTFSENNNLAFITTNQPVTSVIPSLPTIPPLKIRNSAGEIQSYFGHPNNNVYPGIYVPGCEFIIPILGTDYIIAEDPVQYGAQPEDEVPVKTERDFFIAP